jgi:hypothetical protein
MTLSRCFPITSTNLCKPGFSPSRAGPASRELGSRGASFGLLFLLSIQLTASAAAGLKCETADRANHSPDNDYKVRMLILAVIAPVLALLSVAIQANIDKENEFPKLFASGKFITQHAIEIFSLVLLLAIGAWTYNLVLNSFSTSRYDGRRGREAQPCRPKPVHF